MTKRIPVIDRDYVFPHPDFPLGINWNRFHPDYPKHTHEFSELVIVGKGTGTNIVDGISYPLSAGDVFVIPKGRIHEYRQTDHLTTYNIYFDAKHLGLQQWDTGLLAGYHALFLIEPVFRKKGGFTSRLRLDQQQLIRVLGIAELLDRELKGEQAGYRLMAMARFMEMICLLSRYYSETTTEDSWKILRIAESVSYMEAHFTEEIDIDSLARKAHTSPRNFHRVFLAATGKTPLAYIIGLRVMKAVHLLEFTDLGITEIAFECGFADSNYFARQFRNLMNESPSEFRKRTA